MNEIYKAPRGTKDILPMQTKLWEIVRKKAIEISNRFGFFEIIIPTFEEEKLFTRSVGEKTDVVQKEMFTFLDLSKRKLALRPEGTASVARSIIENGLLNNPLPIKLFYIINCFRNERPQKGRYKEFYQFGVELFGVDSHLAEIEVISLAKMFFEELNIKNLKLNINSIGCLSCRKDYILKLTSYFKKNQNKLCKTCQERLEKNPLRILDCKEEECIFLRKNAPNILDHICPSCKEHFEMVKSLLNYNKVEYIVNNEIVRGLDYYTRTVFEFITDELGSQNTICGGGRYDNLIEEIGGPKTPGLGFAVGLNRLMLLLENKEKIENRCDLFLGWLSQEGSFKTIEIANNLRKKNLNIITNLMEKSAKSQIKYANKINAKYSAIIGENEIKSNTINLKDMMSKQIYNFNLDSFEFEFLNIFKKGEI